MVSGPPLLHRPAPAEHQRLEEVRGRLRDSLGGISNLDQLLRSLRVGPKALETVLPDVLASCGDILSSANELLSVIERYLPTPDAARALREFVESRVKGLELGLGKANARPMNAKNRLQLETVVDRASLDLGAARYLIDLLDEALWSPAVRVSLHDMVREASKSPVSAAESVESIGITLASSPDRPEALVNPRVGMGLVGIAVAHVASRHPNAVPHVSVSSQDGKSVLSVGAERGEGEGLMIVRRPLIAPALPTLGAAASLSGAAVDRPEDGSRVVLSWSAAAS